MHLRSILLLLLLLLSPFLQIDIDPASEISLCQSSMLIAGFEFSVYANPFKPELRRLQTGTSMEELIQKVADPKLRSQMERVASFHGYLSTGAFIGMQMLNIAHRVLGLTDGERIVVTCETHNCLPDPFQILAGSTIGNKGLKIKDYGKMAVTVSRRGPAGSQVKSVRIMLDPAKTAQYPRLHAWFMNTAKVPHLEAVSTLLDAGENVYSWEILDQEVPAKPKKIIALCEKCGESFILRDGKRICLACQSSSQAASEGDQTISISHSEEAKCL